MMADAKPLASLSSGLLARKGGASPAMRRQATLSGGAAAHTGHDDLGWNDMGYDVNPDQTPDQPHAKNVADLRPMLSPMVSNASAPELVQAADGVPAVVRQQEDLVQQFTAQPAAKVQALANFEMPSAVSAPRKPRERAGAKGKYAFTLRIDPDRHIKLRLASALQNLSAQSMLTKALDQLLDGVPGLDAMASQAKSAKSAL
jgi:hypothetical protein